MNISMGLSSPLQRSPLSLKIRGHQTSKKRLWHLKSKKRPMAKHRCGRPRLDGIEPAWKDVSERIMEGKRRAILDDQAVECAKSVAGFKAQHFPGQFSH